MTTLLHAALVSALLGWCGPSAVRRLIVAVGVDPVKAESLWPFSHIGEERFETVCPTFAHANAPGSVVFIAARPWRIAPTFGALPDLVCRIPSVGASFRVAVDRGRLPVFAHVARRLLPVKATTTLNTAVPDVVTDDHRLVPTVTATSPVSLLAFVSRRSAFYHRQSVELLAGDFDR